MKKFEYKVIDTFLFDKSNQEIEQELNSLGSDGWELSDILQIDKGGTLSNKVIIKKYVFKKEIE